MIGFVGFFDFWLGASVWCFGGSVFFTAGFCAAVVFCSASPLAPKGTRLSLKMPAAFPKVNRRMRWRDGKYGF